MHVGQPQSPNGANHVPFHTRMEPEKGQHKQAIDSRAHTHTHTPLWAVYHSHPQLQDVSSKLNSDPK